uniref:Uncharacterized protein n=1 Tax=Solanum tuberosum TaxID=4113 RepID=M1DHT9_SOLTU
MWTKEQRNDTNRQKGIKQAEEVEKSNPGDRQDHSANRRVALQTSQSSSVPALREETKSVTYMGSQRIVDRFRNNKLDHPKSRQAELRSKARHDPSRIPESTPPTSALVPHPAHTVVPAPPIQGHPWLLNRLKDEGFRTNLEEKRLSIDGVVAKHPDVWDTLQFHKLEIFTRTRGPYIPT